MSCKLWVVFIMLCDLLTVVSLPATHKDEALIKFKNFFYYEHKLDADAEQVRLCSLTYKLHCILGKVLRY